MTMLYCVTHSHNDNVQFSSVIPLSKFSTLPVLIMHILKIDSKGWRKMNMTYFEIAMLKKKNLMLDTFMYVSSQGPVIMEHLEKPYILGNGGFWIVGAKSQYLQWYLCEVDESVMWDYPNYGKVVKHFCS